MSETASSKVSSALAINYGAAQIGGQIYRDAPGLFLLIFMTTVLGINPALAGVVIFVPKIWILISDMAAGIISDNTKSSMGRRRPHILFGGLISAALFWGMFAVPDGLSENGRALYICVLFLLFSTAYSFFTVPYLSMAAEISDDPKERTKVLAYRMGFLSIGLLIATAGSNYLVAFFSASEGVPDIDGYKGMAVVLAVIGVLSTVWTFIGTRNAPFIPQAKVDVPFKVLVKTALENRPFLILVLSGILQLFGAGLAYTAFLFYTTFNLGLNFQQVTLIFLISSITILPSQPFWFKVAAMRGKRFAYGLGMVLYMIVLLIWWLAAPISPYIVYFNAFLLGVSNSGFALMGFSMLTDVIEYDRRRTGVAREGVFSAIWMTIDKASMAAGALVTGLVLAAFGFVKSESGQTVQQPDSAYLGILICFVFVPFVTKALSLFALRYYDLDENRLRATTLDARFAKSASATPEDTKTAGASTPAE